MVNFKAQEPPKLRVRFKEVGTNAASHELVAFHTAKPVHTKSRKIEYVRATRTSRSYTRREKFPVTEAHRGQTSKGSNTRRIESPQERITVPRVVFTSNPSLVSSMDTAAYQEYLKSAGIQAPQFEASLH